MFLSLGLSLVAYIVSEATTATAMHILKTVIYSQFNSITVKILLLGIAMGATMLIGTFAANHFIKKMVGTVLQDFQPKLRRKRGRYENI